MKHILFFSFAVVIAVFASMAFTTDDDANKIRDGKYFRSTYVIDYLADPSVTPDGAATGLLIRSEPGWNGGYFKVNIAFSGTAGQSLDVEIYGGVRLGYTNSSALTNLWVGYVTSNAGGKYIGTNGTTTYTSLSSTNTNTNGNNQHVQCLYASKSNRVLYTTLGTTNNNTGTALATVKMPGIGAACGIMTLGTLADTFRYVNATTPVMRSTPTYYLPPDTYYLVRFTNNGRGVIELTNIYVELEFTRK